MTCSYKKTHISKWHLRISVSIQCTKECIEIKCVLDELTIKYFTFLWYIILLPAGY